MRVKAYNMYICVYERTRRVSTRAAASCAPGRPLPSSLARACVRKARAAEARLPAVKLLVLVVVLVPDPRCG